MATVMLNWGLFMSIPCFPVKGMDLLPPVG